MEKLQCIHCGSTDFTHEENDFLRCKYCHSLFRLHKPHNEDTSGPKVVIKSGAHVVFGKNSNVVIKGGLKVEKDAHVEFLGKLEVIEKSSHEKISEARKQVASLQAEK